MRSHAPVPVVAVMGPTASGKTALAADLARRFDGEIVSVDSAQVYRGMDIGTAKASAGLRREIPHHLLDLRDPANAYSAAEFRADAKAAIAAIRQRGRLPVLAGGTGLYFHALFRGLAPMPPSDPAVREALAGRARREGTPALHRRLQRVDPAAAGRIHPNDFQRLQRALEVFELTQKPISDWQAPAGGDADLVPCRLIIRPARRALLHERIAERFDAMLRAGLVDEVRALYERGDLHADLPAIRAVGYRQVWAWLAGDGDFAQMTGRARAATRQLAKRQLTWLRREPNACRLSVSGTEGSADSAATRAFKRVERFLAAGAGRPAGSAESGGKWPRMW